MIDEELSINEEKFAQLYVDYGNASKAYREVYDVTNCTDKTVWEEASRVKNRPKVSARIKKLTQELIEDKYSPKRRLDMLGDIIAKCTGEKSFVVTRKTGDIQVKSFKPTAAVQAINEMNKMLGGHAPVKVEEKSESEVTYTELQTPNNGREGPALKGQKKDESGD